MAFGLFAGAQHVNLARHGRQGGSAGYRIGIIEHDAVVGIAGLLADFVQGIFRVGPFVAKCRRLNRILLASTPGRSAPTVASV